MKIIEIISHYKSTDNLSRLFENRKKYHPNTYFIIVDNSNTFFFIIYLKIDNFILSYIYKSKMNIKIFNYDLPADLDLSDEKEVALDNEALGLVLGRDPLTLVQIGLKSKNFFLIKLNRNNYNAPNLKKFLSNPNTEFIMHYARQDLLWLQYHLNVKPKKIFCTKIASKIARTASQYHGYKELVKEMIANDLRKQKIEL